MADVSRDEGTGGNLTVSDARQFGVVARSVLAERAGSRA